MHSLFRLFSLLSEIKCVVAVAKDEEEAKEGEEKPEAGPRGIASNAAQDEGAGKQNHQNQPDSAEGIDTIKVGRLLTALTVFCVSFNGISFTVSFF